MFLKTGGLKKMMKSSLKRQGLIVGNINGHYIVYSDHWGVYVEHEFASNKFKAAVIELIGDLPEPYECYRYTIVPEKGITQESELNYPDPYEQWKEAKDFGVAAPICLVNWPHEYIVYQRGSDKQFVVVPRDLTIAVISASELDGTCEHMPGRPSILHGAVLYFKNESTIYWVNTEPPGSRVMEVLFPHLAGISFFEDDWLEKDDVETEGEVTNGIENIGDAAEEPLPY